MKTKALLMVFIASLVLAACGSSPESEHIVRLPNGDTQETTSSVDELPTFLDGHSEEMRLVYALAGQSADLLQWIPCYCGCGESAGHRSSKNCFVKDIHEDGSVIWDDHGTRCNICLQIAVESVQMKMNGASDLEIRHFIDEKYSQAGLAAPTETPMPM